MLIILMYHQIYTPSEDPENRLRSFKSHLQSLISDNFHFVLPGDKLEKNKKYVLLTFDDAYYDFYAKIYPILKEFNIPAAIGIPTSFIQDKTIAKPINRLNITYPNDQLVFANKPNITYLCTWQEIKEMTDSNLVYPCSHSHSHPNLRNLADNPNSLLNHYVELKDEIIQSKQILKQKLNKNIDTLIYPFGATNNTAHNIVREHYKYALRIGTAINYRWEQNNGLLYRIDGEKFIKENSNNTNHNKKHHKITKTQLLTWKIKYFLNRLRNK